MHLIRNSVKYISAKDYKAFTARMKAAEAGFERFKQAWSQYPGQLMSGCVAGSMWNSYIIMGVQCGK